MPGLRAVEPLLLGNARWPRTSWAHRFDLAIPFRDYGMIGLFWGRGSLPTNSASTPDLGRPKQKEDI